MAADSLVTEKAVVDLANAVNANKAGKSELEAIANAVDALPVAPVADTTDFAALLDPVGGGGGGGASQSQVDALQAKVDAMPTLVVVSDPALAPAGSIAVVVAQ